MPHYSKKVMEHFNHPRNEGRLKEPDAVGIAGKPMRPPFMVLHVRIRDGLIEAVRYQTFGCVPAIAAGSALTEMMVGRSVDQCLTLTAKDVKQALDGLPRKRAFCAQLAIASMRNALVAASKPISPSDERQVTKPLER